MKHVLVIGLFFTATCSMSAQEAEIRQVINTFFQNMYKRDTAALHKAFVPAAMLYTFSFDAKGNPRAKGDSVNDFLRSVALIGDDQYEERLTGWQCLVDDGVASVWAPYEFYFEGKFSHCGVDVIQLIKVQNQWKITQLTDTRRKDNCIDNEEKRFVIDSLVNEWHHAAAVADEKAFFGFMTADCIYIGTDATERWKRDELALWSQKYFERESAWDFKPVSRNIEFGPAGDVAWFDELLDTWMGTCRSTGIVQLMDGQWRLRHYQLSITLPNEKLEDFKKLIGKK